MDSTDNVSTVNSRILSLLIGFEYNKNNNNNNIEGNKDRNKNKECEQIYGSIIDIYNFYRYSKKIFSEKIVVITDIDEQSVNRKLLLKCIFDEIVDADILSFIKDIKLRNEYYECKDKEMLKVILKSLNKDQRYEKIFLYFTGHGMDQNIVCPDEMIFDSNTLLSLILSLSDESTDIFCLFDCCKHPDLGLPFKLDGFPRIHKSKTLVKNNFDFMSDLEINYSFFPQRITLLTSRDCNNNTKSQSSGSIMSQKLYIELTKLCECVGAVKSKKIFDPKIVKDILIFDYNQLKKRIDNLCKEFKQELHIYSSYPDNLLIPNWIVGINYNDIYFSGSFFYQYH